MTDAGAAPAGERVFRLIHGALLVGVVVIGVVFTVPAQRAINQRISAGAAHVEPSPA